MNIFAEGKGYELLNNRIRLTDWKQNFLDFLRENAVEAVLSPVIEIPAPHLTDFVAGPPFENSSLLNTLGFTGGVVPFGRVTQEDEEEPYEDYKHDRLEASIKKCLK